MDLIGVMAWQWDKRHGHEDGQFFGFDPLRTLSGTRKETNEQLAAAVPQAMTSESPPLITSWNGTGRRSTCQPNDSAIPISDLVVTDFRIDSDAGTTSVGFSSAPFAAGFLIPIKLDVENSSM